MFRVIFQGKALRRKFQTYEQARSYARKLIRKSPDYVPSWDGTNPAITYFGYHVTQG